MRRKTKNSAVPLLRFPEFGEAGVWNTRTLSEVCRVTQGGTPDTTVDSFWGGSVQWITPAEMGKGESPYVNRTLRTITEQGLTNCSSELLPENSVIISTRAPIGHLAINKSPMAMNQGCRGLIPLPQTDNYFVYCYLLASKSALNDLGSGNTFKELSGRLLKSFPFTVPIYAEQQKIADCLSSLDELIAAQARKVHALKTHKKGLMQQLFPREGETQPRLRFPEFRGVREWAAISIGDLKPFVTSGSRGWAAFYADQGELFVRMTNLWRDSINLDLKDSKFVQLPSGANEGLRTRLKEHDVLISITADIGIIGYVDKSVPFPAYINQHIALVRFDSAKLCGKYVAYFLASDESQRLFRASTDTGSKAGMSLIGIPKIGLKLPSLAEQQRIADCLTSLDTLINTATQALDTLKTHKKALMQQLFPLAEAVEA